MSGVVHIDRRLWLTADKARVVEDGDRAAAFLWHIAGETVTAAEAARVGFGVQPDPEPEEEVTEPDPEPEAKMVDAPPNKAVIAAPENKRARKR